MIAVVIVVMMMVFIVVVILLTQCLPYLPVSRPAGAAHLKGIPPLMLKGPRHPSSNRANGRDYDRIWNAPHPL